MKCGRIIRGGFSFCGVDIAELGLSYAPENENVYVYRPTEFNVHQETFDGHDGGYFYGISRQPKEFVLRCYFEEETIDHGVMEKIYSLFRAGKSGKLIFSRRPWCYYYATVTSLPHPELSNYMNGLITITMTASYPFARGDDFYNAQDSIMHDTVMESTSLVEESNMVPAMSFKNVRAAKEFILHNPGTEYSPLSITASGNAGLGIIIRNKTTNQECKIVAMDKAHTTNVSRSVYIDGINGLTMLVGASESKPAFLYHDSGFIQLEPAYPSIRDVYVLEADSNLVTLYNTLYSDVVGQYIFINGEWCRIEEQVSEQQIRVNKTVTVTDENKTMITKMNELEIVPVSTMDISQISFSYKPTYA